MITVRRFIPTLLLAAAASAALITHTMPYGQLPTPVVIAALATAAAGLVALAVEYRLAPGGFWDAILMAIVGVLAAVGLGLDLAAVHIPPAAAWWTLPIVGAASILAVWVDHRQAARP